MKAITTLIIAGSMYVSVAEAAERCESIASSLIRAAMITPTSAYDFRPSEKQLISMCNIGSDAAAKGENINDAIIANLNYRNEMARKISDGNKAVLELADLAFQLGFDTYNK
ncbi:MULTISPECIES: hypothetical protein [Serratia]|jgi:hypothetical protein|uniref:hypothetical protein n=1 Tax=Serratia TaxID=613 RepID=UPI0007607178|nr:MULTISPECIES: hypothetical protein [Serratia]MBH2801507.1 hypothetical protein [Serratia ureilytica]MBH2821224.1 hypothetical protein [Serratia ureilytica]MBH2965214.1 hypothetical protein [Serratia ureilytica]MDR4884262.1 hypothetical protein [Serratia marcescens]MDU2603344.1 hypothetical protein [Serratia marcescens]